VSTRRQPRGPTRPARHARHHEAGTPREGFTGGACPPPSPGVFRRGLALSPCRPFKLVQQLCDLKFSYCFFFWGGREREGEDLSAKTLILSSALKGSSQTMADALSSKGLERSHQGNSHGMLLYELLYCFEIFALLCALLSLTADPAPLEYIFVYSLLLTFLVLFFCAQSHQQRIADQAEHTIGMIVFSILSSLVSFFVVQHWSGGCPTKRSSGLLLVVVVLTLAILHMSTREETRAGTVILLRTVMSTTCSVYFVVIAAQDANSWCLHTGISVPLSVHQS
jgi:hypothetical protein